MLEINLLPKELRDKRRDTDEASRLLFFKALAVFLVFLIVLVHVFMFFYQQGNRESLQTLEEQYQALGPRREEVREISEEIEDLQKKIGAIGEIAGPEVQWRDLLSGINKAIIPNVWLFTIDDGAAVGAGGRVTQEKRDSNHILIRGYALGESEQATSLVAKFITSLKSEDDFSRFFKNIELDSMQNQSIKDEEVMQFVLKCDFK